MRLLIWRGSAERCSYAPFREVVLGIQTGGNRLGVVKDGRSVEGWSQPGLVTIVPPATPIVWDVFGEVHSCTLHLPPERFQALVDDTPCEDLMRDIRFEFALRDPFIAESASLLVHELHNPTQRGPLYADAMADAIAMHLLQHHSESHFDRIRAGKLPAAMLAKVYEHIESRVAEGTTLDELAKICDMSRSQFTRAFRASTGTSPHKYLLGRRIARATEKLLHGVPMVNIAFACGFSSQSHFTDMFRRAVGVTPAAFRRSVRPARTMGNSRPN
ncbi:hypothetical protein B1810_02045 [Panacagrimonas perspica]|uniref:helix-turn-helix domain-containing protein n=1 Tax=Panacagrimonas perspica TaxID=381431 RepID=UPI00113CFD31|nr:AraC family transcriptional regulator [Panacagrimonas perspica]THD05523.1 hypothetical protein B1810_02045 [Panacagrimonas perspica]